MRNVIAETVSKVEELSDEDFEELFAGSPLIITDSEVKD